MFAKWARDFQKHTNELPMFDPEVSLAAGVIPISLTTTVLDSSGRRSTSARMRILELPVKQLLDGIAGLPLSHDTHQQTSCPL